MPRRVAAATLCLIAASTSRAVEGMAIPPTARPTSRPPSNRSTGRSGWQVAATGGPGAAADRLIFWAGCERVAALTDDELDFWEESGVDGFVCMVGRLRELRRDPGLHRRRGRVADRRSVRAPANAARLGDRRAGRGARDEDVPGRLPLELQQHGHAAGRLVRRRRPGRRSPSLGSATSPAAAEAPRVRRARARSGALRPEGRGRDRDLGVGLPRQHPLRGRGAGSCAESAASRSWRQCSASSRGPSSRSTTSRSPATGTSWSRRRSTGSRTPPRTSSTSTSGTA